MKVLIIGVDSTLGSFLFKKLTNEKFEVLGTSRVKDNCGKKIFYLDLFKPYDLKNILKENSFNVCFLCAAITNINYCSQNINLSNKINYTNTSVLLDELIKYKIKIIFFSTNLSNLFSIKKSLYKSEIKNYYYALLKFKIEKKYNEKLCIIKLSKVIDKNHELFEDWISCLKKGQFINPFSNKTFSPIYIDRIFITIIKNIHNLKNKIYNLGPCDEITYLNAAKKIANILNLDINLILGKKDASENINQIISNDIDNKVLDSLSSIDEYIYNRND